MCLTGDNMRKFNEIYEMMKYGYELINRAYTKEDAAKIHYALKSKIYNLFENDKEEVEFYIEKIKLQNNNSFESYTSDYIKQMGIDKKCDDIKRLFILFSSNEIKDNLYFANFIINTDARNGSNYYELLSKRVKKIDDFAMNLLYIKSKGNKKALDSFLELPKDSQESKNVVLYALKLEKRKNSDNYVENVYNKLFSNKDSYQEKQPSIVNNWLEDELFIKELCNIDSGFVDYIIEGAIAKTLPKKVAKK